MLVDVLVRVNCKKRKFEKCEQFVPEVSLAWSINGTIFPMLSQSGVIYECAFNKEFGYIVAFNEITVQEFRTRLTSAAERLFTQKMIEASQQAAEAVAPLYETALRFR